MAKNFLNLKFNPKIFNQVLSVSLCLKKYKNLEMEEQDKILLSSLRSLGYPIPKGATIDSIDYPVLFDSCKYYLQRCGVDQTKLPQVD